MVSLGRNLTLICGLLFLVALVGASRADTNRLYLAAQPYWQANSGFYLSLESMGPAGAPLRLSVAKLILAVADGSAWHRITASQEWTYDRDYTIDAHIQNNNVRLTVDGAPAGQIECGFTPDVGLPTGWMSATTRKGSLYADLVRTGNDYPTEYVLLERSIRLSVAGKTRCDVDNLSVSKESLPNVLFAGPQPTRIDNCSETAGQPIDLEVRFRFAAMPTLRASEPLVDAYGQARYRNWPGKVHSDADLKKAVAAERRSLEKMPAPTDMDRFGGSTSLGWRVAATGYYSVMRRHGLWWLIDPAGYPCFYTSLDSMGGATTTYGTQVTGRTALFSWLPPKTGPLSSAWFGQNSVSFDTANLIRKYGENWPKDALNSAAARFRAWGFAGMGKWSKPQPSIPNVPVIGWWVGVPNLVAHPDIFDAQVRKELYAAMAGQIRPRVHDPYVVGWSIGNEDQCIQPDEITRILQMDADVPAKQAIMDYAVSNLYGQNLPKLCAAWKVEAPTRNVLYSSKPAPPDSDIEQMRRFYEERYYSFLYETVKSIDPNHLYLGNWIVPFWWPNAIDWAITARHVDVIGTDYYAVEFSNDDMDSWMRKSDKPVLIGEFGFPQLYAGNRGFGQWGTSWSNDEQDAGDLYARWIKEAALNPYCVGVGYFEYRDEPITGRGDSGQGSYIGLGESYACGLVDVTDRPKGLIEQVRSANLGASRLRNKARAQTR